MRIALASDHAGVDLKEEIAQLLAEHDLRDFGTHDRAPFDLPDSVYPAALAVGEGRADRGVFVDGVGYGSALIANKVPGVYAAVCQDPFCATLARSHSDTNVLCLGAKVIGSALAVETVRAWMATDFLADVPKYVARVQKVRDIAERHVRAAT